MSVSSTVLAQLAGKPMAYDVLLWLQNVVYALNRGNLPERFFSWPELFAATTHEYTRVNDFTTYWKRALTEALRYYQDAQVELVRGVRGKPGGVIVKRSPLLVPPKRGAWERPPSGWARTDLRRPTCSTCLCKRLTNSRKPCAPMQSTDWREGSNEKGKHCADTIGRQDV